MAGWTIEYFTSTAGKIPVKDFIDELPEKYQTKVFNTFELLQEFGLLIGSSRIKKFSGTPLWELRLLGEQSLRFIFLVKPNKKFLLLHGFVKKTNKTPRQELKTALKRVC